MSADIETTGIEQVVALVNTDLKPALRAVSLAIAAEAQDRIAPYPGQTHKKQAFKTTQQRRGFFAKLRSGKIHVPYRRRGAGGGVLGGWLIEPTDNGARLRNMRRGAKYVHSAKEQARYHAGNWTTDQMTADEINNDGTAGRMVEQAVQKVFNPGG